jgi:hypothetical protein
LIFFVTFQQFIGQADRDFQTRLKSFINNQVIKISNPIIQEEDSEQREAPFAILSLASFSKALKNS